MSEQRTTGGPGGEGNGVLEDLSELRRELDRRQEEILRLRDLLIARDAELGTLKGRLAELSEHSARLSVALHVLRARLPGLLRRLAALRPRG